MDRSEHRRPTGITVVGTGTVSTPVDRVTINLAVDVSYSFIDPRVRVS